MTVTADNKDQMDKAMLSQLRAKHKLEIDAVLEMNTPEQKQAFRNLGVRPSAIKEYYQELILENEELKHKHVTAESTSTFLGWIASLGTAAAFYLAPPLKKHLHKSNVINVISVSIASVLAGFATGFISTRILNHDTRSRARKLVTSAREALTNELAIALELQSHALPEAPVVPPAKPLSLAERAQAPGGGFVSRIRQENQNTGIAPSF